ncbi:Natural resistance-associated macrophage protein [Acididesulfobacillus acetoxydans]|uniref:Natural resistance-associated macrophage protein n=1 Tax=Acididesulfobacillus acetoxydans TaxID=1561005 RepID=A0A8S0WM65_9FIRM|nr:Nramp family divalent metal transporter [Acididesulfobacillus acetoxydans]CAA7600414.1 Natural resistance-associated macrophage protein [Acididesulfobacillus acetoxydans]CEJ06548.1 Natural resistance-associated macrophage protein [Acididesulfobacillus acetoxydans]
MKVWKEKFNWRNILIFLSIIGPGIITANVDNDAGGITTYSVAGAHFGFKFLWVFIPMTLALIVVQEMSARMGAITGKGLADLIRENFGVRLTLFILAGLLIADVGNTVSEFAGVASSGDIFGLSKYIVVPVSGLVVWLLVVKGTYRRVEKIFLIASALYITYIFAGFLARPNWGQVARATFIPSFSTDSAYIAMFVGLVGTTIAPWMQFYIQSSVVEKGITAKEYKYSRLDVIFGCFMTDIVAVFIVVACAATLYKSGIVISDAQHAAIALRPLAGQYASVLFALGLFDASIFSATILPLATAYYVCEALGFEAGVDKSFKEAPQFYTLYTIIIILGVAIILVPKAPLVPIMLWSQVINGILLPFVLVFMLFLINNRKLMGSYTNSKLFNGVAWSTTVIMIGLTLLLVVSSLFPTVFG